MRVHRSPSERARETSDPATRPKAPSTEATAHLLDLQRHAGNAAVSAMIARQRTAARERSLTLEDFQEAVRRFGVTRVRTGTVEDQAMLLNQGGDHLGDVLQNDIAEHHFPWVEWSPGGSSPTYASILAGFEDFERGLGGMPRVREIWFFEFGIEPVTVGGQLRVRRGEAAAEFGGERLFIYKAAEAQATQKVIPVRRDRPGRRSGTDRPTRDVGMRRVVAHELGHGVQELAYQRAREAADSRPGLMDRYRAQVGWFRAGDRERLYDIGVPEVARALEAGEEPDAGFLITKDTWDSGRWREQPISKYMVRESFEDFGEAVMAYVHRPSALEARSPRRFAFVRDLAEELFGSDAEEEPEER